MTIEAYDQGNVFARILRGELPAHKVYEDHATLAFMDLMPRCDGHTLVIPKAPARNILDATPESLAACVASIQTISRGLIKAYVADGITLAQYNEAASGQVVFHLHFHVMPRHTGVSLGPHTGKMADQAHLAVQAEHIRTALASL